MDLFGIKCSSIPFYQMPLIKPCLRCLFIGAVNIRRQSPVIYKHTQIFICMPVYFTDSSKKQLFVTELPSVRLSMYEKKYSLAKELITLKGIYHFFAPIRKAAAAGAWVDVLHKCFIH